MANPKDTTPVVRAQAPTHVPLAEEAGGIPLAPRAEEARYRDLGAIGKGGTSTVIEAWDRVLARRIARKVLESRYALRADNVARFAEEARITAQLDHPNIVPIHELAVDATGLHYFTMKRVVGSTFGAMLREGRGSLPVHLDVLLKVCDAVSFAHSRGILHRDIKPGNVMVGEFGEVYVMDWGLACANGSLNGVATGTPAYMAPEQTRIDARVDVRTDVYGIGGLLFYVLCTRAPHAGVTLVERVAGGTQITAPLPTDVVPERPLPPALCRIALRALAVDPAARYGSVAELRADLAGFMRGGLWFDTHTWEAGAIIVKEGDLGDAAYIIVEGECDVIVGSTCVRRLGANDTFGETAVLTGGRRTATVVAVTTVRARVVTREALDVELGHDTWLGSFVRALVNRFREVSER